MSGLLFTPLLGVPMRSALDICVAWAITGIFMRKTFWPRARLSSQHQASAPMTVEATPSPQLTPPCLFARWAQVAGGLGLPIVHHDSNDAPVASSEAAQSCFFEAERKDFILANRILFHRLVGQVMPLETIADDVLDAIYGQEQEQVEMLWSTLLWEVAIRKQYWFDVSTQSLPHVIQINCGGLGGNSLDSPIPPHFHCTSPPVSGCCVYGPSLSPADCTESTRTGVAAGHTTSLHELATLMLLRSSSVVICWVLCSSNVVIGWMPWCASVVIVVLRLLELGN